MCLFLPVQQQLNTSFDDETAALLNDCYTLEEKERLKEEWRLFEEQKRNFERERKNFTEAAIRLGREVLKSSEVVPQFYSTYSILWVNANLFVIHRKGPFRRTVLLGSRISF